ncbi:MAG: bifunctional diaminohydroxyphosphoribosylaminopyrimidine deaminase/5-amino-6-(5-phosphoribosylamino)uracil reductase RibD [Bacteroidetes bacterium]|nr:bifunctional diaminohydroxyphosphoribosylaminopyrimidine deaminase/5-amino-6-(5-phosphoribosylamino)uracil reductase RibD [Bacteroidota bacterium]
MQQALNLAKQGFPDVAPNPLVGCVIVKDDKIVAQGYHQKFGEAHAEVNAINNLPAQLSTANCQLYITLEPCSHFGKTPPCADLIISKGFKTVVIACKDPNPLVSGNGIKKLQQAGIEVITGVLEQEARELNKQFITYFEKKRPYISLKWAMTADGFISKNPVSKNREENVITGIEAQTYVHQMRAETMAIMVGKNTVLNDNPTLTTRLVKGKNPIRIFIDKNLEVSPHFNIYNAEAPTLVFNSQKDEMQNNIRFIKLNFENHVLEQILETLYHLKIQSLLVEGGTTLLNSFINQNLWDEAFIFQNPKLNFGTGIKAPELLLGENFEKVGKDFLYRLKNTKE